MKEHWEMNLERRILAVMSEANDPGPVVTSSFYARDNEPTGEVIQMTAQRVYYFWATSDGMEVSISAPISTATKDEIGDGYMSILLWKISSKERDTLIAEKQKSIKDLMAQKAARMLARCDAQEGQWALVVGGG